MERLLSQMIPCAISKKTILYLHVTFIKNPLYLLSVYKSVLKDSFLTKTHSECSVRILLFLNPFHSPLFLLKSFFSRATCISYYYTLKSKVKCNEKFLENLSRAHSCSQAKCHQVQTSYKKASNKMIASFPVTLHTVHVINMLLKPSLQCSLSVWENLDLGSEYRPHCIRSVHTTSVKILPYRPPAQLIRTKY